MHSFCICYFSDTFWHCPNELRQSLSAVALLDKYHISDIVYNALFPHRNRFCQSTLSKCKTKDIAAAHCMTILAWSSSWRVANTICTISCLPEKCRLTGLFLISAQPKIWLKLIGEKLSHNVYHHLQPLLSFPNKNSLCFIIVTGRTKNEQLLGTYTCWSYWHTSFSYKAILYPDPPCIVNMCVIYKKVYRHMHTISIVCIIFN